MRLMPKIYEFKTSVRWKNSRRGELLSKGREKIEVGCPTEFGGDPDCWTPEHLFVASIETCVMTTFLWMIDKLGGKILNYESDSSGKAYMQGSEFRFNEVTVKPMILVQDKEDFLKAQRAIEYAKRECLITKALNIKVNVEPRIELKAAIGCDG